MEVVLCSSCGPCEKPSSVDSILIFLDFPGLSTVKLLIFSPLSLTLLWGDALR